MLIKNNKSAFNNALNLSSIMNVNVKEGGANIGLPYLPSKVTSTAYIESECG